MLISWHRIFLQEQRIRTIVVFERHFIGQDRQMEREQRIRTIVLRKIFDRARQTDREKIENEQSKCHPRMMPKTWMTYA